MSHVSRAMQVCTAQRPNGAFCDRPSIPDAPFPICVRCAAMILHHLNGYMPNNFVDQIIMGTRMVEQQRERDAERRRLRPQLEVVYYIEVGRHIKIGYTTNLKSRLASYPPDSKLLAYEYGPRSLEQQRHHQFADDLDARNEWFRPSAVLREHINKLRAARKAAA